MSALGQLVDRQGVFSKTLTESDTFPYDTSDYDVVYMSIVNDGTVDAQLELTYKDTNKGTGTLYVPAGQTFSAIVYRFDSINALAGDSYKIALYERGSI
jgi:hypothetical protein